MAKKYISPELRRIMEMYSGRNGSESTFRTAEERAAAKKYLPKRRVKPSTPDPIRQRIEARDLRVSENQTVDPLGIRRKAYAFYIFASGQGIVLTEAMWPIGFEMYGIVTPMQKEIFLAECKGIELDLLDRRSKTDFKFRKVEFHMKVYETDPYRAQVSKNKQPMRFRVPGKEGTKDPARGTRAEPRVTRRQPADRAAALQKAAAATLSVLRTQTVPGPAGQQSGLPEQRGQAY